MEKPKTKYQLVALDVDGTLLNDHQEVVPANIATIKALKAQGIHFVVVTGRPDVAVADIISQLAIEAPVLGYNGASIRDVESKEVHRLSFIDEAIVRQLHHFFEEKQLFVRFYGLECVYTLNVHEFDKEKNALIAYSERLRSLIPFEIMDNIDVLFANQIGVLKITLVSEDQQLLTQITEELSAFDVAVFQASSAAIDIMALHISKGQALLEYAAMLGIEQEAIVAIGDGDNDLSMFEVVGMPVVMGNAEDAIKQKAKLVTASNNEAGVSKALQALFNMT